MIVDKTLYEIDITVRSTLILKDYGVHTVKDLLDFDTGTMDIHNNTGLGRKTVKEISEVQEFLRKQVREEEHTNLREVKRQDFDMYWKSVKVILHNDSNGIVWAHPMASRSEIFKLVNQAEAEGYKATVKGAGVLVEKINETH